jgi:4-amino-4-deoxy-L-arabinose transferase-like glycosyltransferase
VYELAFEPDQPQSAAQSKSAKPAKPAKPKRPAKANPSNPAPPRSTAALSEPRNTNVWRNLLLFALLMLVCLPVLVVNLGQPDVVDPSEASNLLRSSQTWARYVSLSRQRGFSLECLIPHENGIPSLDEPPGLTWTHMVWFMTMDPDHVTPGQLILRARLCGVFFALLTIICVYWAGYSLGRHRTAMFSMLIFAANPVFIYYARFATPTMLHTGWGMLAIATSLWAIRPLRPLPSTERQFTGWIICGLAMGAATLVAGPITLATIAAPVFLLILFCPDRVSHLIGLLASMLIAVLLVVPWLMYAHEHNQQVWEHWLASIISVKQLQPGFLWHQSLIRGLWLLLAFVPWLMWIGAVVAQPLSRSSKGLRRISLWLASGWSLGVIALVLPMPTPTRLSELLPLIPPICLAVGQLFNHLGDLCKVDHPPRTWRWLRWPQACLLLALSLIIPWCLANQQGLVSSGFLPASMTMAIPSHVIIALLLSLVGLWVLSLPGVINHRPGRAAVCWSLWCLAIATVVIAPMSRTQAASFAGRNEALNLSTHLDQAALLWLQRDVEPAPIDPRVLFYLQRTVPQITFSQLDRALLTLRSEGAAHHVVLIGPMDLKIDHPDVRAMGLLRESRLRLWRYDIAATTSPPATDQQ